MPYISESSLQKSCSRKILYRFPLREVGSHQGCRIFQSLHYRKVVQERFYVDSNSEKSDPKIRSGRPNHAPGRPSVSRSRTVQSCIRLDALQSSRRFQLSFTDTDWEDSLHPSGRQGNTVRTPRSLIRKLRAYTLHPSGQQGNTVRIRSYNGNYV